MSELNEMVPELKNALSAILIELAEGEVSPIVLEDFKVTVDSARTSVLALLTAKDSGDYYAFVRKYRLRRAGQICQNVLSGIIDGTIDATTPGLDQLLITVDETLERLEQIDSA
jgi:hypothetical protein